MGSSVPPELGGSPRAVVTPFPFGYLVHDVSRIRRTLMDFYLRPLGLTRSQWRVMSTLSRCGEAGLVQSELARQVDVGKVTLAGLVERMEAAGHVERLPDPMDKRVKRVCITEQGYAMLEQIVAVTTVMNARILERVDAGDLLIAEKVLGQVKDNMRAHLATIPNADLPLSDIIAETIQPIIPD